MAVKVCKFGGTSLADANQIRKSRDIVLADPQRRYVVPSAPGKRTKEDQKITDLLYLCHAHAKQGLPVKDVFAVVAGRYRQIVADLKLKLDIDKHLAIVEKTIAGGASADYAASRGEYLNGLIVADLLGWPFIDAADVIHFDKHGRFLPDVTQDLMSKSLSKHERAVVPGFYGSTSDGQVKTFSRGGSDITGSIVARGASADVYENWTDVSGMLMADPRIVEQPRNIETVTYRELRELAYMGASVLHDEAIFPVRKAGIPVNIRNTNDPKHPGTMIVSE
ncbi:MAG: aspartate kinase, partial [Phycisphaeraceae bacterium]|nr:aspartate kinase [Phycisphaeraceae bacterium]